MITWHEVWGKHWSKYSNVGEFGEWTEQFVAKLSWGKHIAVSDFTATRLNTTLKVPREKIEVVSNGICPKFFGNHKKDRGKIIFVGRLTPDKHAHDLLIEGFKEARKVFPRLHLCVIGSGPLLPLIKRKAQKLKNVQVHVDLPREEVIKHVKSSSIACFPSEREGNGIAAMETLAAGCPVVTADFRLNAIAHDLIINDFNGYVVGPEPKLIAEGILKTFENWDELHHNCPKSVENFSWDESEKRLEGIYEEVIS